VSEYSLFHRADLPDIICAVPKKLSPPAFIKNAPWLLGGIVEDSTLARSSFDHRAAESSVRYNGFYLFQLRVPLSRLSDQFGVEEGAVTDNRHARRDVEDELDRELEQTFPASDPLKITRSAPPRGSADADPALSQSGLSHPV
jgi:hypothetical protein